MWAGTCAGARKIRPPFVGRNEGGSGIEKSLSFPVADAVDSLSAIRGG